MILPPFSIPWLRGWYQFLFWPNVVRPLVFLAKWRVASWRLFTQVFLCWFNARKMWMMMTFGNMEKRNILLPLLLGSIHQTLAQQHLEEWHSRKLHLAYEQSTILYSEYWHSAYEHYAAAAWVHRGNTKGGSMYRWPLVWLVWNQLYDNWQFLFLFANRLIKTGQTGCQGYSDSSPFSIPWSIHQTFALRHLEEWHSRKWHLAQEQSTI